MMNSQTIVESLSSSDLRSATHDLVRKSNGGEADLIVHLGEIDERKLYLDWSFSSMFGFCLGELGFSEDVACNRINVARAARTMPVILEALRSGKVHLAGLRLLAPHLTTENQEKVLAEAAGKSKRQIEELVARLSPQPAVPTMVRKLPDRGNSAFASPNSFAAAAPVETAPAFAFAAPTAPASAPARRRGDHRANVTPLAEETYKFQFTASRACHDKFRRAQELLRHRVPDGDAAVIFEKALDLLIEQVRKERFGIGRKPRQASGDAGDVRGPCTVAHSWNEPGHRPPARCRMPEVRQDERNIIRPGAGHGASTRARVDPSKRGTPCIELAAVGRPT